MYQKVNFYPVYEDSAGRLYDETGKLLQPFNRIVGGNATQIQTAYGGTTIRAYCHYCGSSAPDDSRGNCGACGAPRWTSKPEFEQIEVTTMGDSERSFVPERFVDAVKRASISCDETARAMKDFGAAYIGAMILDTEKAILG